MLCFVLLLLLLSLICPLGASQMIGQVRLSGGSTAHEGNVEIYHDNYGWLHVTSGSCTIRNGGVMCHQLGYDAVAAVHSRSLCESHQFAFNISCNGRERNIIQCLYGIIRSTAGIDVCGVQCASNHIMLCTVIIVII
jgi:hypothetical protein